jgi:uncharacterized integral membrane protein
VTYDPPPRTPDRPAFVARHLLALIVLVAAVVFIIENTRRVRIRALGPEVTAPLWLVLLITLVAGMLVLALIQRRRRR